MLCNNSNIHYHQIAPSIFIFSLYQPNTSAFNNVVFDSGRELDGSLVGTDFACIANGISAIKINITNNNGGYNTRINAIEIYDGTTSLVPEKTEDDGSASGDDTGWTASADTYTNNDYIIKFIDIGGAIKYYSWTTGDDHTISFEGHSIEIDENPLLSLNTMVQLQNNQTIEGIKTFSDGIVLGEEGILEGQPETISIPVVLLNDQVVSGVAEAFYTCPYNFTITGIRASLAQAQATGNILTIDVNAGGTSLLTTKLTIDNTEKSSTTAATPAVLDAAEVELSDSTDITIDIDQIGDGTAYGLYIQLIGYRTLS